ncbi:MAG: redoxin domain-containing protein [Acidobacteria bacterium]|nr:redoxin domain-containing protein [Acidobacteriota bacterium]
MNPVWIAALTAYVLLALGGWIVYQVIRQNGRILVRLDTLEKRLAADTAPSQPPGLPRGTAAPPFELPTLDGSVVSLERLQGQKVLLMFFDPRCGFCREMAPRLGAIDSAGADGRPLLVLVTTGDVEENRKCFAEHKISAPVVIQPRRDIASLYRASGTPMGYLIDERGLIASDLAAGSQALLELARGPAEQAPRAYGGNRPLSASRINRNGLAAGTPAPPFRLPRVGGGDLFLTDYRGRKVLLVFSDPHCGPCHRLAPQLEQHHRNGAGVDILMVSRGEESENLQKASELGLTFPVVLQRHWEVSRAYGMFSTPSGFLIDENGVIARNVAVGPDAILLTLNEAGAAS